MTTGRAFVGRQAERARLAQSLERAAAGSGSLVLLAGEAGAGKTRLAEEALGARALRAGARSGGGAPYAPIAGALRSQLRTRPQALSDCGPLRPHLALLLPELGEPAPASDRATLFEAVRCALEHLATDPPLVVLLDDLHWSDVATVELLAALAQPLRDMPVLVVAAYRSDALPRDHVLRWLRNELRRAGMLDELAVEPLGLEDTGELLAAALGANPSPSLLGVVHDRSQGLPFFVEELAAALAAGARLQPGPQGLELASHGELPVPESVRDAVLMSAADMPDEVRAAAEAAAVAGESFDLGLVAEVSSEPGLAALVERGLLHEDGAGRASFRHALARDAFYADVAWLRRRALHRRLAEALEAAGGQSIEVATHWLGAREPGRARDALVRATAEFEALYAYRDVASAARQALDLWPEEEAGPARAELLERYARCAQLAGELAEAAKAWRELSAIHVAAGEQVPLAEAQRQLAAVHELKGERELAFTVRLSAAQAFEANGRPADAAVERLAMANHRRFGARYGEAIQLARAAGADAARAERVDLRARALGLEGLAQAMGGDMSRGLDTVRTGLALALEHDLTAVAAELYQRLGMVLYDSSDYRRSRDALDAALGLCRSNGNESSEAACATCLMWVLRERGEWARAIALGRELTAAGTSVWVVEGVIGVIHAFRGKYGSARRMISSCLATSTQLDHYHMWLDSTIGLAYVSAADGSPDEAAEHCRRLLERWEESEDRHYAVWPLEWSAAWLAGRGDRAGAHACAEALSRIASDTAHANALAGLAHAIGELALLDGDAETAAEQLSRAVEIHRSLDVPFERANVELRAGVALAAVGEREPAIERLTRAYRSARKLGARPLAAEAANVIASLGESVARRVSPRDPEHAALTRRELEVTRLLAVGRTNREIAQELFLSPRTVDMHVRNILRKLDCRSRVEIAHQAGKLGLLAET